MEQKKRLFNDIVRTISLVLDFDEGRKLHHALRVGVLSSTIAEEMAINDSALVYYGGLLHDIGGIGLKDHLIHHAKKGFTDDEAREHPVRGASILRPFKLFKPIIPFIQHHHEHFDGSGFPAGIKDNDIPVEASILLAADVLEIQLRDETEEKRYIKAIDVIKKNSGKMIHPDVAEATIAVIRHRPHILLSLFDDVFLKEMSLQIEFPPPGIDKMNRLEMLSQLLWMLARLIDIKSAYLLGHSTRTAFYALKIAQAFGKEEVNGWDVIWAGLTHDIGMVGIPRTVLTQLLPLNTEEEEMVKQHAQNTATILSGIRDLSYLSYPAGSHHENYDGSGYPFGTSGEDIPLIGRILAFSDDYDRLTKRVPHPISHKDAIDAIRRECRTRFDPHIADVALSVLENYGLSSEKSLAEPEAFHQVFQFDDADIDQLFNQEMESRSILAPNGKGVLLQSIPQWQNASISMDFIIQRGKKELQQILQHIHSDNFLNFIHNKDRQVFRKTVFALSPWEAISKYLFTPKGNPFEIIITQKTASIDLLSGLLNKTFSRSKKHLCYTEIF